MATTSGDNRLTVELVAREGVLWQGDCSYVQVPVADGFLGILPRRQPLLATLSSGQVTITVDGGDDHDFTVDTGFVSVDSDVVTIVADHGSVS